MAMVSILDTESQFFVKGNTLPKQMLFVNFELSPPGSFFCRQYD